MVPISLQERDCCGRMGNKVLGKLEVQVHIVFARAFMFTVTKEGKTRNKGLHSVGGIAASRTC